jgi:hypothetical protein
MSINETILSNTDACDYVYDQLAQYDHDEGLNKMEYREFYNEWRRQIFENYETRPTAVDDFDKLWSNPDKLGIAEDGFIDRHEFYG